MPTYKQNLQNIRSRSHKKTLKYKNFLLIKGGEDADSKYYAKYYSDMLEILNYKKQNSKNDNEKNLLITNITELLNIYNLSESSIKEKLMHVIDNLMNKINRPKNLKPRPKRKPNNSNSKEKVGVRQTLTPKSRLKTIANTVISQNRTIKHFKKNLIKELKEFLNETKDEKMKELKKQLLCEIESCDYKTSLKKSHSQRPSNLSAEHSHTSTIDTSIQTHSTSRKSTTVSMKRLNYNKIKEILNKMSYNLSSNNHGDVNIKSKIDNFITLINNHNNKNYMNNHNDGHSL